MIVPQSSGGNSQARQSNSNTGKLWLWRDNVKPNKLPIVGLYGYLDCFVLCGNEQMREGCIEVRGSVG